MHKILVIRLYFALGALHVSDYFSPSSEATFISCVAIATQHSDVSTYTKCDVQLINVASDDGLK